MDRRSSAHRANSPVLAPRHREDVAHEEVQAKPRKLPSAIGRQRHGAEDTPVGGGVELAKLNADARKIGQALL